MLPQALVKQYHNIYVTAIYIATIYSLERLLTALNLTLDIITTVLSTTAHLQIIKCSTG
jgi:hypothetical protein